MSEKVRVRFAPSPTGALHIGGVRTALFNYLFAKKHKGTVILRIEDTDQNRFVEGAEQYIRESLNWIGMKFDEGEGIGGEYGPYKQSERKALYKKYAQQLLEEGKAYYAFDTAEELGEIRKKLEAEKKTFIYNSQSRMSMKNALTLSEAEVKQRISDGAAYVIRLKVPENEEVTLHDLIRGEVTVNSNTIDDKILLKSDGMPTYHLANVVDDYLMKISHVIRGEEWLPSTPLHVLLYQNFGWEASMPKFAHLPLLLKPSGQGKLSKRDADKMGFPIFPLNWKDPKTGEVATGFKEAGYLPDAFLNFLAFLGWNPGTEQEIFSLSQLIDAFSIERVGKSGTQFDIEKAKWYNQQYIKEKPSEELSKYLLSSLEKEGIDCTKEKAKDVSELMKERVTFPNELYTGAKYFFNAPETFDEKTVKKRWTEQAVAVLNDFQEALASTNPFEAEKVKEALVTVLEKGETPMGRVMPAVRLAISGVGGGPDLMKTIEIIGKEPSIARINFALVALNDRVKIKTTEGN